MKRINKMLLAVPFVILAFLNQPAKAYAGFWEGHPRAYRAEPRHHHSYGGIVFGLPQGVLTLYFGGERYFYHEGIYYQSCAKGYEIVQAPPVIVQQPVLVAAPAPAPAGSAAVAIAAIPDTQNEFTVNIPNSQGGYTAVTLKRSGKGFTGPQGEFYPEFPKVEQLKTMYVK